MLFLISCVVHHTNIGYVRQLSDQQPEALAIAHHIEVLGISGPSVQTKFTTASNQVSLGWGLNTASLLTDNCPVCELLLPRVGINFIDYSYDNGTVYWGAGSPYTMLIVPTPFCLNFTTKACLGFFAQMEYLIRFKESDRIYGSAGVSFEVLRMPSNTD